MLIILINRYMCVYNIKMSFLVVLFYYNFYNLYTIFYITPSLLSSISMVLESLEKRKKKNNQKTNKPILTLNSCSRWIIDEFVEEHTFKTRQAILCHRIFRSKGQSKVTGLES
uniref:Uncharacterized protein n=1 Tax=Cacopsylla melanoneura TaxID=428564 RepID=A0A8D8WVU1_9HEMI